MVDMRASPLYSLAPTMPPGWQGIPYMLGPLVADMTGGVARPYVAPNMATYDATIAAQVNNPLYQTMMAGMYGQLGSQLGTMLGGMQFVQSLGAAAGYSPAETQRALRGGMEAFARSKLGSAVMPFLDMGLNAIGLTGGSFVAATQAAFNGRMNLMGPGSLINPLNAGQQHQAMAAASATATMLNGIMSRRDDQGRLLPMTDQQVMQGFSRERVTQLAMRAAGMGMFTSNAAQGLDGTISTGTGGLSDRLTQAIGIQGFDLSMLTKANFEGRADGALGDDKAAERVRAIHTEVKRKIQGLTEAMGAMRDLTGFVDEELEQLLDNVTNGNWARSGNAAFRARDALRTLHATSLAYNLDPKQALSQVIYNRSVLQNDAGFSPAMLAMGFDGGGMFGLGAQTELFAGIEDTISRRGVGGDPVLAGRIRKQGLQAMRQNMNSVAGRAAQILAYARQTGAVSDEEAGGFAEMLTSGDSGLMGAGLNRLLTTVFGSAEVGRRFMNDSMQMNSMRNAMDDNAGKFAMTMMMNGSDAEFRRREQMSAASQRLAFTQQALSGSGMNTWQSAEGANKVVENIVSTIRGDGRDQGRVDDANAFKAQFDAMVARGMDPRSAANAVVAAYKRSPVTSQYAQEIDLAVKRQSAINNEEVLMAHGLESRQATALVRELSARGSISGKDSAEIYRLVREGKGAEALSRVDQIVSGLDYATRGQMDRVRSYAAKQHADALETMRSNQEAESLIALAAEGNYGSEDVAKAYETMAAAGLRYAKSAKKDEDYEVFWESVSKTKFANMFGADALKQHIDAAQSGDVEHFQTMGRRAGAVRRIAVANLKGSGYDLGMSGYWGGGDSSVSSAEARKVRDATINDIAEQMNVDAFLQADDRNPLAAKVVDLLMGRKDWKSLLSVYGDEDLKSGIAKYGAAFGRYEKAQAAFNETQEGYKAALGDLTKAGQFDAFSRVQEVFGKAGEIDVAALERHLANATPETRQKILDAANARNKVTAAQADTKSALKETVHDDEMRKKLQGFTSWSTVRDSRNAKLTGDAKVTAFMDAFDFSEEGIKGASGASKDFLDKMFAAVSDDEVAAKAGVKSSKGIKQKYGEYAMSIVREKAMQGDEMAISALKAARAAQRDEATRIHGEITIKSGWDSSPAVLEGNMGGLS